MLRTTFLLITVCSPVAVLAYPAEIDFQKQIAPILERNCIRCHSPADRQGKISLTTVADLEANGYLVPGDPDSSYLISLVTPENEKPPAMPKEGRRLTLQEITLLRNWVAQGAKWPQDVILKPAPAGDRSWWSWQPLVKVTPPNAAPHLPAWQKNPIDRFILAKLIEHRLTPSPAADRLTLLRRLTFDLHGLPPTPDQVKAFLNDEEVNADEKLIDRLLNSPRYGERFAQHWLDLAHYADTHGFERDRRRDNAWRYRDYVIQSFNDDKPWFRFLREQIAGDVLWPDDVQSIVATGFLAAGPFDFVGQKETRSPVLRRSARSLDLDDMITQVMTSTMGITINCARCHDHKLDPVSQKEYYQLRAVFAGVQREDRTVSRTALERYEVRRKTLQNKLNQIEGDIGRLEGSGWDLADIVGGGNGLGNGHERQGLDARTGQVQTRDFGALDDVKLNQFSPVEFDFVDGVFIPEGKNGVAQIPITSTGLTISGLPTTSGAAWDMIRNGPVASQHSPELDGIDFTKNGHSLLGLHANAGITFDLQKIRQATGSGDLQLTAQVGYFGAKGNFRADAWVYVDGKQVAKYSGLKREAGLQNLTVRLSAQSRFLTFISTDGGNGYSHDQIGFGDPRVKPVTPKQLSAAEQNRLNRLRQERKKLREEITSLGPLPRFYGVVASENLPQVKLLQRGNPETPIGPALAPGSLSALAMLNPELGKITTSESDRRVALANWITHSDNPLTPRVIVNRLWQWHFGQGLVNTPSDFGAGGGLPSHPRLLDWLAVEFIRQNGSLKAMHRLILTSETYRQQSRFTSADRGAQLDAENRLLWRQNPRRLEAEAIRDAVLSVSGNLNLNPGGPGFEDFRYQDAYAPIYTYVVADRPELWRRSIYRYRVRTTPNRFLTTLDCPDPANLTAVRLTTTTPLQSLALYNNEFMLQQARYFADRIKKEAGEEVAAQISHAFLLAFGRHPTPQETQLTTRFLQEENLFSLCRSLLNANEFLYVD